MIYFEIHRCQTDRKAKPKELDMGGRNMDYTINFIWDLEANKSCCKMGVLLIYIFY